MPQSDLQLLTAREAEYCGFQLEFLSAPGFVIDCLLDFAIIG